MGELQRGQAWDGRAAALWCPLAFAGSAWGFVAAVRLTAAGNVLVIQNLAPLVAKLAPSYSHVFGATTSFGKNLMPRVAALLDVAQISDIVAVESADTFVRPIYAGNAMATVQSADAVKSSSTRKWKRMCRESMPSAM